MVLYISNLYDKYEYEFSLLIRYLLLIFLIIIFNTDWFVEIITIPFYHAAYWFLNLFTETVLTPNSLIVNGDSVFLIIPACIAASAYIFISVILLTMPVKLRLVFDMLWKTLVVFTFVNLIRILFLMWLHVAYGQSTFESVHMIFYEFVSGILVAGIVIYFLRRNKIRKIYPVISDVKMLVLEIRNGRINKKKKLHIKKK